MKQITVISGKGGTGKTTITAAFASLAGSAVIADCDVDAADLHLILEPEIQKNEIFRGGRTAMIDPEKCTQCGLCMNLCRFNAVEDYKVDPVSCEGCAFCANACPVGAISMEQNISGKWFVSDTRFGPMTHAKLGIAEENSGKLVTLVRQQAKLLAAKENREFIIVDGPPGIGCPVIAAISGVDLLVAVTEPTLSGIHDLERVIGTAKHFNVPVLVCVNKFDINMENTSMIDDFCKKNNLQMAGKIKYDKQVVEAMVAGKSIVEHQCGEITEQVTGLWKKVNEYLGV